MATQTVYPVADGATTDWTPSTGSVHFSLVDEVTPNETDTIGVNGFSSGKVEQLVMGKGTAGTMVAVRSIRFRLHMNSAAIANVPALRVRVYFNGVQIYFQEFWCDTGGVWDDIYFTIPALSILGANWDAGTWQLEMIPINGDTGYSPAS